MRKSTVLGLVSVLTFAVLSHAADGSPRLGRVGAPVQFQASYYLSVTYLSWASGPQDEPAQPFLQIWAIPGNPETSPLSHAGQIARDGFPQGGPNGQAWVPPSQIASVHVVQQ